MQGWLDGGPLCGATQDQTSTRSNTLSDDADDIQKQLDNEARDRLKYGKRRDPFRHYKKKARGHKMDTWPLTSVQWDYSQPNCTYWDYNSQSTWANIYPSCSGQSQSPVNIPNEGLIKVRGARKLMFYNYDTEPKSMMLRYEENKLILHGEWEKKDWPLVYGGAAHNRRYFFHSLVIRWPSEHYVNYVQFPVETQALHISADYSTMDEAIESSPHDPLAILGIINLYGFGSYTHEGLNTLLNTASKAILHNSSINIKPLNYFNPTFNKYASYQGSLTSPPCTESVLWLTRGNTLSIARDVAKTMFQMLGPNEEPFRTHYRAVQPLNDRKVFVFC